MNKFKFCPLCSHKLVKKSQPFDEYKRLICLNCGFVFYQNPTPTVLAIIEKGNQILLAKRATRPYKSYWDLPGGFVEVGQNLETALRQEIKEELGIEVKAMSFFGSFISKYQTKKIKEPICCCVFNVTIENENFKAGSDVVSVRWFAKNKLPRLAPQKDVRAAMKKFLSHGT